MNLFMIRLENGNVRIVQAKDEQDALEQGSCTENATQPVTDSAETS